MMNPSFDPKDETLKCGLCNHPLSVPPILHSASLGNICGRCEDKAIFSEKNGDSTLQRQTIFENIAKYVPFPCCYHVLGCTSQLKWDDVRKHEDICEFKNIVCPLTHENFEVQCRWIGEHSQLAAHINKDHKKFFSIPPIINITKELGSKIIFSEVTGRIIVIMLDYKKNLNKYYCCIAADLQRKDCTNYQYQIEICSNQWDNPVILRKTHLEPLYGNTYTRPDNSLEIPVDSIKHLFCRSNEIKIKFQILQKNSQEITSTSSNLPANLTLNMTESAELNEDLLHDLECPVCFEFMTPKIYICEAGHNVCSSCNNRIAMCPMCRGNMLGGRNYTLEKLTATINYPCINRGNGCGFVSLLCEVKNHEKNCLLMEKECFISNCSWKGTNMGLLPHIELSHACLQLNVVNSHELQKKIDQYILIFDNKIFLLRIRFGINQPLEFIVQCVGGKEGEYKYELQIIGCSLIDIKVTLCHLCQPLPYSAERRNFREFTGISVPFTFLSQFLTHFHQLQFKINITRINE